MSTDYANWLTSKQIWDCVIGVTEKRYEYSKKRLFGIIVSNQSSQNSEQDSDSVTQNQRICERFDGRAMGSDQSVAANAPLGSRATHAFGLTVCAQCDAVYRAERLPVRKPTKRIPASEQRLLSLSQIVSRRHLGTDVSEVFAGGWTKIQMVVLRVYRKSDAIQKAAQTKKIRVIPTLTHRKFRDKNARFDSQRLPDL